MSKLRLVNEVESEAIWDIVNEWWKENSSAFNDYQSLAKRAVAEFCANQEGLTMFKYRAMSEEEIKKQEEEEKRKANKGNVKFVEMGDTFFGDGSNYESDVFYNHTWLDVAVLANEMIIATGDKHHVFLEGVIHTGREQGAGIQTVRFCMGS